MKSLGVFAVLAVLTIGVAAAQSSQDLGNVKTSGATFAEGIVQASSSTSLSIQKEGGSRLTFLVDGHTVNATNHAVGSRVKINFHTNENGVAIADEVQGPGDSSKTVTAPTPMASQPSTSSTYATPAAPAPAPAPAPMMATTREPMTTTAAPAPAPAAADATVKTAPRTRLPKTASPLVGIGLIGLAALAGFAVLRSVR